MSKIVVSRPIKFHYCHFANKLTENKHSSCVFFLAIYFTFIRHYVDSFYSAVIKSLSMESDKHRVKLILEKGSQVMITF